MTDEQWEHFPEAYRKVGDAFATQAVSNVQNGGYYCTLIEAIVTPWQRMQMSRVIDVAEQALAMGRQLGLPIDKQLDEDIAVARKVCSITEIL